MFVKKLQGFQDPNTSRRTADQFPNVDHVLVGNGSLSKRWNLQHLEGKICIINLIQEPWMGVNMKTDLEKVR